MKNAGDSFTFVFKDPDWPAKILLGGAFLLLSLVFVGAPVVYGYCIELQQRVRRGEQFPLPEWKDVGVKFVTGFKYLVTVIIYAIPIVIVVAAAAIVAAAASFAGPRPEALFGGLISIAVIFFILPLALLLSILSPFISLAFGTRERIADGLNVVTVFGGLRRYWPEAIIVILLSAAASVAALAGLIIVFIGVLFTSFYALLVRYHLFGQIGRIADAAQLPAAP